MYNVKHKKNVGAVEEKGQRVRIKKNKPQALASGEGPKILEWGNDRRE